MTTTSTAAAARRSLSESSAFGDHRRGEGSRNFPDPRYHGRSNQQQQQRHSMEIPDPNSSLDSRFVDPWETITDQPPNPRSFSAVSSDEDDDNDNDDDEDEWIRDPYFDNLDRVVIM